jgi:hypothetical protein
VFIYWSHGDLAVVFSLSKPKPFDQFTVYDRSGDLDPKEVKIPGHLIKWRRDYQSREALASLLATRRTDSPASIDLHPSRSKLRGIEPTGNKNNPLGTYVEISRDWNSGIDSETDKAK